MQIKLSGKSPSISFPPTVQSQHCHYCRQLYHLHLLLQSLKESQTRLPQMCHPHPVPLHAPKEISGAFSRSLWTSREEEPGEDTGDGYRLFGGVSQARELQSTNTSWKKNLRSKSSPKRTRWSQAGGSDGPLAMPRPEILLFWNRYFGSP